MPFFWPLEYHTRTTTSKLNHNMSKELGELGDLKGASVAGGQSRAGGIPGILSNAGKTEGDVGKHETQGQAPGKVEGNTGKTEGDLGKGQGGKTEGDLGKLEGGKTEGLAKTEGDLGKTEGNLGKTEGNLGKTEGSLGKAEGNLGKTEGDLKRK